MALRFILLFRTTWFIKWILRFCAKLKQWPWVRDVVFLDLNCGCVYKWYWSCIEVKWYMTTKVFFKNYHCKNSYFVFNIISGIWQNKSLTDRHTHYYIVLYLNVCVCVCVGVGIYLPGRAPSYSDTETRGDCWCLVPSPAAEDLYRKQPTVKSHL